MALPTKAPISGSSSGFSDGTYSEPTSSSSSPVKSISIADYFFEFGLVEVYCHPNQWCDGYLVDVEVLDSIAMVTVAMAVADELPAVTLSNLKHLRKCRLEHIRIKTKADVGDKLSLAESDLVEVLTKTEGDRFICWKLAKIKRIKGGNLAVQFINAEGFVDQTENFDIVSLGDIRLPGGSSTVAAGWPSFNPFFSFELVLPPELLRNDKLSPTDWLGDYNLHKEFKKLCQLLNVHFNSVKGCLVCLGFTPDGPNSLIREQTIKRLQLLSEMHFRRLRETQALLISRVEAERVSIVRLQIDPRFTGLAIGRNGANIQRARKMPGIRSIEFDDSCCAFIIRGDSLDVCRCAAAQLHFVEEKVIIPFSYREFFSNKELINEMIDKSGVQQLQYQAPPTLNHAAQSISLNVLGTLETIENFKFILNYQLNEYQEIKILEAKYLKMYGTLPQAFLAERSNGSRRYQENNSRRFADVVKATR